MTTALLMGNSKYLYTILNLTGIGKKQSANIFSCKEKHRGMALMYNATFDSSMLSIKF